VYRVYISVAIDEKLNNCYRDLEVLVYELNRAAPFDFV
jgi:hypothetical protein